MTAATHPDIAPWNNESPSTALNDRPYRFASNYNGRGCAPVIAIGMILSRVVFNIVGFPSPRQLHESGYPAQAQTLDPGLPAERV
jgi:hypothetical protein